MKHRMRSTGLAHAIPFTYRHLMFVEGDEGGGSPAEKPTAPEDPQGDPADLGEGGKKALTAERNARKAAEESARTLQAKLDEIAQQNMSDLERAQAEAQQHKDAATKATTEALRWRIAAKHQISDEDAETFLTGGDETSLTRQAERLSALAVKTPSTPRPDPSQGHRQVGGISAADAGRAEAQRRYGASNGTK